MDIKQKLQNFNKRWSIIDDSSHEDEFIKFKKRILNIFSDIDNQVTEESIRLFCQFYGTSEKWEHSMYRDDKWSKNIINRLNGENDEIEFYKLLEVIFSLSITSLEGYGREVYSKGSIYEEVCQAIDLSNVNLATTVTKDREIIFYPKGEKKLDNELVNFPLSFLNKESGEHFIQALKSCQSKEHIKSAESLRRSLEEFLKYKLSNSSGLASNILTLQQQLKLDGRDAQIRNIIFQTFSYLDKYFYDNSKHNDGDIDESENEFLIYQAGLLLRYIDKVISN
jgi:hypothetical protein